MSFERKEGNVLKETSNQEVFGLKRVLPSFRSYGHVEESPKSKGSESHVDENRKSQIISFKEGFAKKRTLSGKVTDMKYSAVFTTDSLHGR